MKSLEPDSISHKVQVPSGEPAGRIACPQCGNATDFIEVADNVILTTHYIQNNDGSFSSRERETDVAGRVRLYCGLCTTDITEYYAHFQEMIF